MMRLKSAVGRSHPNNPDDVRVVQRLLNTAMTRMGSPVRLLEDGRFGPRTEAAIVQFQSRRLRMHAPDGVVDPNGATIRMLSANAPHRHEPTYVTAFINMALPIARNVKKKWGVPVAVTIAQSAQETGWGRTVVDNAYFGIKGRSPDGSSTDFATTEVVGGKVIHIKAQFRAYTSYADSADDYGRFLSENPRYKEAFANKNDPYRFVQAIAKAGYATDPDYARALMSIIRVHALDKYDD
jgi:flagellar protein FlgJ